MCKLALTGHRVYSIKKDLSMQEMIAIKGKLEEEILLKVNHQNVKTIITGMALGVDQWGALIAMRLKKSNPSLKLIAHVPCRDYERNWTSPQQKVYQHILSNCDDVKYVSESYTDKCLKERNESMVNDADFVLGVWNGKYKSGTASCLRYALKEEKDVTVINSNDLTVRHIKKGENL